MKTLMTGLLAGTMALAAMPGAFAADALTLQLKWVTQAQFAGYLVAEAKGFYDEEDLDVTVLAGDRRRRRRHHRHLDGCRHGSA
jgi:NitT/TauT family transport system substrate-binding protein